MCFGEVGAICGKVFMERAKSAENLEGLTRINLPGLCRFPADAPCSERGTNWRQFATRCDRNVDRKGMPVDVIVLVNKPALTGIFFSDLVKSLGFCKEIGDIGTRWTAAVYKY